MEIRDKMQTAASYEKQIMSQHPKGALPTLTGYQLENMALVLYGPDATTDLTKQYYIANCSGTVDSKGNCSTGWQWIENFVGNYNGVTYADDVRAGTIPQ